MKRIWTLLCGVGAVTALALVFVAVPGCEDEPSTDVADMSYQGQPRAATGTSDLSIEPAQASPTYLTQEILFTVTGGRGPYHWSVADGTAGTITMQQSKRQAIYKVLALRENTVKCSDNYGKTITAPIKRYISSLKCSPSYLELNAVNEVASLNAVGGTPDYSWSVVYPAKGTISAVSVDTVTATYRRDTPTAQSSTNTVILTDADGNTVEIPVYQYAN